MRKICEVLWKTFILAISCGQEIRAPKTLQTGSFYGFESDYLCKNIIWKECF